MSNHQYSELGICCVCGAGQDGRSCAGDRPSVRGPAGDRRWIRQALAVVSPRSMGAALWSFTVVFVVSMVDLMLVFATRPADVWGLPPYGATMGRLEHAWEQRRFPTADSEPLLRRLDELGDGWGEPIRFDVTEDGWRVGSLGRDRAVGGSGADRDLWMDDHGEVTAATLGDFLRSSAPVVGAQSSVFLALLLTFALGVLSVVMRALGDATSGQRLGCGLSVVLVALPCIHVMNTLILTPPR